MRFDRGSQDLNLNRHEVVDEIQAVIGSTRQISIKTSGTKLLMLEIPDATQLEWDAVLQRIDIRWPTARL